MSEGNLRCDRICAPLGITGVTVTPSLYNRVYEAVDKLPDATATRLVKAIADEFERERSERGKELNRG